MADPTGQRHVVLGTADPWIVARISALRQLLPMVEMRLDWGYRNAPDAADASGPGRPVRVAIPPRSLGRLRHVFRPVVRDRIRKAAGGVPDVVWIVLPVHWPVVEAFPEARVVYIAADDYRFYGWPEEVVGRYEAALVRKADLVVAVSSALAEHLVRRGADRDKTIVSPNGLPASWIPREPPGGPAAFPPGLASLPRPVAGVIGRIGRRLRLDWIETAARRLPAVHWLFVGPPDDDPQVRSWHARMSSLPNCHFVGPQPYDQLAAIHAALDLSILPYADFGVNPRASPVRLFSSLPFPAPIVATQGCRQLEEFGHYLHLCRTSHEFVETIARLGGSDPTWPARHAIAPLHTWEKRARDVVVAAVEKGILPWHLVSSDAPEPAA